MKCGTEYKKIETLAKRSGFTRHDAEAFFLAYQMACRSSFGEYRTGCVIVCGNQVVGKGFNSSKTDPTQKIYNIRHRNFVQGDYSSKEHSLHAEMMALKSIPYTVGRKINWNKAKAYVFRIAPGLPFGQGVSAPCAACAHALADAGVKKVFFSTDYGFASSALAKDGEFDLSVIGSENACASGKCLRRGRED